MEYLFDKRVYIPIGIILIALTLIIGWIDRSSSQTYTSNDRFRGDTVRVVVQEVELHDFSQSYRATGTLSAKQRATLRTIVGGPVDNVPVDIGQEVQKDDTLLQIREIDYELALEQAQSDLAQADAEFEQAKRDLQRTRELHKNGTTSEQDLDQAITSFNQAEAARLQAEAARNTAQQNLDDAAIKAPYDGIITERHFEPGEFAPEGEAAVEILNLGLMEANLEIPEKYLGLIQDSSQVVVEFEADYHTRIGNVVAISPKVSSETRTFRIRIQIENKDMTLPSGLFISAHILLNNINDRAAVPEEALQNRDGTTFVWTYENGLAKRTPVEEGISQDGWVLIRNGISKGDHIIIDGTQSLVENYPVKY